MSDEIINRYIKINDIPNFVETEPADFLTLTEEQLGIADITGPDNQSPVARDPANWFVFDCGEYDPIDFMPEDPSERVNPKLNASEKPWFLRHFYTNNDLDYQGTNNANRFDMLVSNNPGGLHPEFISTHFETSHFYKEGGPRNKGYMEIDEKSWIRINNYVPVAAVPPYTATLRNEAWRSGAIELTIRPIKSNCSILSGEIFPAGRSAGSTSIEGAETPFKQITLSQMNDGTNTPQTLQLGLEQGVGVGQEIAYPVNQVAVLGGDSTGLVIDDESLGLNLTSIRHTFRSFAVDLVNGILRVRYEIFYGPNKKYVEFFGKTNLVDGQWHHVVINRPAFDTLKTSEEAYGGTGCIEIWVDGQLQNRSFEITQSDIIPTPHVLFNNGLNTGILNYTLYDGDNYRTRTQVADWLGEEWAKTGYAGGIRDFIFRQSKALSPHQINLNYAYAMLNTETSKILKAKRLTATATMVNPTVTSSKPKVLKLYWNDLLKNKETMLNGLEFDDSYDIYSYSVTHKNLLSSSQTFNLDLNDPLKERKYLTNVRVAVGQHMFIPGPGLLMTATDTFPWLPSAAPTGFTGDPIMIDTTNDARVIAEAVPFPWYINNMQFAGVDLVLNDRILLFNQHKQNENGIWIFNGLNKPMTRAADADISVLENAHVYVEQGKYAGKTFIQTEIVKHTRKDSQIWREIDTNASSTTIESYPIHTVPWSDSYGNQSFINVNTDVVEDFDIIAFMNYPTTSAEILNSFNNINDIEVNKKYKEFMNSLKTAVNNGKRLFVSSPLLALDLGIVNKITYVPQLLNESGDAQSASISPFESGEAAENYFDTHRNNKYKVVAQLSGLTNRETYIMSDFVTYSPNRINSDYHIKYNYRQFGLQEGDEFFIPGLTTLPETLNGQLPGYLYNQKGVKDLAVFPINQINMGTVITQLSSNVYNGSTPVTNPYNDYATTIAVNYGSGKMFVNCVENSYAFSRSEYNIARIQNVVAGQNAETVATAAWQYSTKRLNKKNLYDFSDASNLIGQTTPTNGGGGGFVQAQSHCSDGLIRAKTNKDDLRFQSDLYPDFTEEYFSTTEIPTLSMTWLGLKWLAE